MICTAAERCYVGLKPLIRSHQRGVEIGWRYRCGDDIQRGTIAGTAPLCQQRQQRGVVAAGVGVSRCAIGRSAGQAGPVAGFVGHAPRDQQVVSVAAAHQVCARAAEQDVVPCGAEQLVVVRAAAEQIVPAVSVEGVVPRAAVQAIVPVVAIQRVIAGSAVGIVVAAAAADSVIAAAAIKDIGAGGTAQDIVAAGGEILRLLLGGICRSVIAPDHIIATAAIDPVVAVAAHQPIVVHRAGEVIIATFAIELRGNCQVRLGQRVIQGAAIDDGLVARAVVSDAGRNPQTHLVRIVGRGIARELDKVGSGRGPSKQIALLHVRQLSLIDQIAVFDFGPEQRLNARSDNRAGARRRDDDGRRVWQRAHIQVQDIAGNIAQRCGQTCRPAAIDVDRRRGTRADQTNRVEHFQADIHHARVDQIARGRAEAIVAVAWIWIVRRIAIEADAGDATGDPARRESTAATDLIGDEQQELIRPSNR